MAELIKEYQPLFKEYGFSVTKLPDLLKTPSHLDKSQSENLHKLKIQFGVKLREKLSELPSNWLKHLLSDFSRD